MELKIPHTYMYTHAYGFFMYTYMNAYNHTHRHASRIHAHIRVCKYVCRYITPMYNTMNLCKGLVITVRSPKYIAELVSLTHAIEGMRTQLAVAFRTPRPTIHDGVAGCRPDDGEGRGHACSMLPGRYIREAEILGLPLMWA